jgi:hypothetical protein
MEPEDRNHTGTKDYSLMDWFFYYLRRHSATGELMTENEILPKKKAKVIPFRRRTPTDKHDFTVRYEGGLVLLVPNTKLGINWANHNIGADNGYQPSWPTVILEPRYVDNVLKGIHRLGLVAR